VVTNVCKVITSSGYPGTDAIIAAESKDDKTNEIVAKGMKDGTVPSTITMSFTTCRGPNEATVTGKVNHKLGLYRVVPLKPQTKPYADNQANTVIKVDNFNFAEKPYSFNLIDVEDVPARRYLWEQMMGMTMTEFTTDRLADRLRRGTGISARDLRSSIKKVKNAIDRAGPKAGGGVTVRLKRELHELKCLQYNVKRWGMETNVNFYEGKWLRWSTLSLWLQYILGGFITWFIGHNLLANGIKGALNLFTGEGRAVIYLTMFVFCIAGILFEEFLYTTKGKFGEQGIEEFRNRNKPMVIQTILLQKQYSGIGDTQTTINYGEWFGLVLRGFVSQRSILSLIGIVYGGVDGFLLISSAIRALTNIGVGFPLWVSIPAMVFVIMAGTYVEGGIWGFLGQKAGFVNKITAIPLGGTGNNFDWQRFMKLCMHDGYNVTEDLDFGTRILISYRRVMLLDGEETEVKEDSQPHAGPRRWWQVARWQIGHFTTGCMFFYALCRHPYRMLRKLSGVRDEAGPVAVIVLGLPRLFAIAPVLFCHFILASLSGIFTIFFYLAADIFLVTQFIFPFGFNLPGIGPVLAACTTAIGSFVPQLYPYITTPQLGLVIFAVSYGFQLFFAWLALFNIRNRFPDQVVNQVDDLKRDLEHLREKGEDYPWAVDGIQRRIEDLTYGRVRLTQVGRRRFYQAILVSLGILPFINAKIPFLLGILAVIAVMEFLDVVPIRLTSIFGERTGRKMYSLAYFGIMNFYNIIWGSHFAAAVVCVFYQLFYGLDSYWAKTYHPALSDYKESLFPFKTMFLKGEVDTKDYWKNFIKVFHFKVPLVFRQSLKESWKQFKFSEPIKSLGVFAFTELEPRWQTVLDNTEARFGNWAKNLAPLTVMVMIAVFWINAFAIRSIDVSQQYESPQLGFHLATSEAKNKFAWYKRTAGQIKDEAKFNLPLVQNWLTYINEAARKNWQDPKAYDPESLERQRLDGLRSEIEYAQKARDAVIESLQTKWEKTGELQKDLDELAEEKMAPAYPGDAKYIADATLQELIKDINSDIEDALKNLDVSELEFSYKAIEVLEEKGLDVNDVEGLRYKLFKIEYDVIGAHIRKAIQNRDLSELNAIKTEIDTFEKRNKVPKSAVQSLRDGVNIAEKEIKQKKRRVVGVIKRVKDFVGRNWMLLIDFIVGFFATFVAVKILVTKHKKPTKESKDDITTGPEPKETTPKEDKKGKNPYTIKTETIGGIISGFTVITSDNKVMAKFQESDKTFSLLKQADKSTHIHVKLPRKFENTPKGVDVSEIKQAIISKVVEEA
ncbi:MAG: hypothetical protein KJ864_04310, partial [Candidatus Omnitrophica bacterium]|nr:hypothetical protein [Candidatus Omnitrophota bacterium]